MSRVICPACGRRTAVEVRIPNYRYRESGIPNLWLEGGVVETRCSSCRAKLVGIEREGELLQVIAASILEDPRPLTGPEMRFLRGAARLSQARLAQALRTRRATVAEREAKADPRVTFGEEVLLRVVLLRGFCRRLDLKGGNFLGAVRRRRLGDLNAWYERFARGYAGRGRGGRRLVATLGAADRWSMGAAA